jgi:hypothetical protein
MDPLISLPQASYSDTGKTLAQNLSESCGKTESWAERRTLLVDGFQKILDSPVVTADEKELARLGKSFADSPVLGAVTDDRSPAEAMQVVMNALVSPFPGPLGKVISQVTLNACDAVGKARNWKESISTLGSHFSTTGKLQWIEKDTILQNGLDALTTGRSTSYNDRALARFGLVINSTDNKGEAVPSRIKARRAVADTIAQSPPGPLAALLARAALQAEGYGDSFDSTYILASAFEAITDDAKIPREVKDMAEQGKHVPSGQGIPEPPEERKEQIAVMKQIPELAAKAEAEEASRNEARKRQELEDMEESLEKTGDADLIIDETHLEIEGVKLSRQSTILPD